MKDLIRIMTSAFFILLVIILLAGGFGLILILGTIGLLAGIAGYILRRFVFKRAMSQRPNNNFSTPDKPAGVPPGPTSHDLDYDIVIDPQTDKEYHIPKRKRT